MTQPDHQADPSPRESGPERFAGWVHEPIFDSLVGDPIVIIARADFDRLTTRTSPQLSEGMAVESEFGRGFDAGWEEAMATRLDREQLGQVIDDYMSAGGTEFRAYDLADRIIRKLVPPMVIR